MITRQELMSVARVIASMRHDFGIDAMDIVQEASLRVLLSGRDLCPETVYGFGRHVLLHESARRKVRLRYRTERRSWIPVPDYGYETPKSDLDLDGLAPREREIMQKLLAQADRNKYGQSGRRRNNWPRFVTDCLAGARQSDARRAVARKTSTIQRKDRQ